MKLLKRSPEEGVWQVHALTFGSDSTQKRYLSDLFHVSDSSLRVAPLLGLRLFEYLHFLGPCLMAPTINTGLTGAATHALARLPAPSTNDVISRGASCYEKN